MTMFDDREDAFERRFANDEALRFQARARRTRAVGLWAAGQLGQQAGTPESYAEGLVRLEIESGSEAVLRKLLDDRAAAGLERSEQDLRHHMDARLVDAAREVRAG